jgi:methionyl-tRNA formyltransferase
MRIACVGYRDWALKIYDKLAGHTDHQFLIFRSKAQYDEQVLRDFKPSIILFYGWSWIVPAKLIKDFQCIMLHPSPLPRYRGGSPLQNQIIAGETESAVTLFLIDEGLDTGPIVAQRTYSLDGSIDDIFRRLTAIGIELTIELIENGLHPIPQTEDGATSFLRRTCEQSEITFDEIKEKTAEYLYNKIRMLQDPYPNAFIRTVDGKKLCIFSAKIEK